MAQYSPQRKHVAEFELVGDRQGLSCQVTEYWKDISQVSVACGNRSEFKVTRRVGVEEKEKRALEGSIQAALGLPGIGKFESALKSQISLETTLTVSEETQHTFTLEAPRCGVRNDTVYQQYREYALSFWRHAWVRSQQWDMTLTEYLPRFHMQPLIYDDPVGCKCNDPGPVYDQPVNCDMGGRMSILAGARKDEQRGDYRINLAGRDVSLRTDLKAPHIVVTDKGFLSAQAMVPKALVPAPLLFLADEARAEIPAAFAPFLFERRARFKAPEMQMEIGELVLEWEEEKERSVQIQLRAE